MMNQQWGLGDLGLLPRTLHVGTRIVVGVYVTIGLLAFLTAPLVAGLMAADPGSSNRPSCTCASSDPRSRASASCSSCSRSWSSSGTGGSPWGSTWPTPPCRSASGILARQGGGPEALYLVVACSNAVGVLVVLPLTFRLVRRKAAEVPAAPVGAEVDTSDVDVDHSIESGVDR
ncbi:hypothetical protein NKG05_14610 [Oerskovia sp. M15]